MIYKEKLVKMVSAYEGVEVNSSAFSGMASISSKPPVCTVEPLHRLDLTDDGDSQLVQSLSSSVSKPRGVHENCFVLPFDLVFSDMALASPALLLPLSLASCLEESSAEFALDLADVDGLRPRPVGVASRSRPDVLGVLAVDAPE